MSISYRFAVKFRKINKETLARLQTLGENEGENPELEASGDEEITETMSADRYCCRSI